MTAKHLDSRIRISLYLVVACVGAVLTAWGVVTQDLVDAILPVAGGILAVGGGVTAVRNITPTDRDQAPAVGEWVGIGRDALPVILGEIGRLRDDLARQSPPLAEASAHEYVPDQAPWLPAPDGYVGRHREG